MLTWVIIITMTCWKDEEFVANLGLMSIPVDMHCLAHAVLLKRVICIKLSWLVLIDI